jgi:phosphatidylglycerol lysyltransferase
VFLVAGAAASDGVRVTGETRARLLRFARSAFMVVVFGGMLIALERMLRSYSYADVVAGIDQVSPGAIALAIGLVAVQYTALILREWLAVRYAGRADLGLRRAALASMIARPLSALGVATITGIGLRTRIYGSWGFSARDIGLVVAFNELVFYVGLVTTCGVVFTVSRVPWPGELARLPPTWIVGALGLVLAAAFAVWCLRRTTPIRIRTVEIPVPDRTQLVAVLTLQTIDLAIISAIVYTLLPASAGLPYLELVAVCLIANLAGSLSQVPAGLGVFEAVVLQFVPAGADQSAVLAALLVRRLITHLLPIVVGGLLLITFEIRRRPLQLRHDWHDDAVATFLAVMTFASGVVLLVIGAGDEIHDALAPTGAPAPIAMFVLGVVLLVVARGLQQRVRRAWWAALGLLVLRAIIELAIGPRSAIVVLVLAQAGLLVAARRIFTERGVVLQAGIASWWAAFAMAVIGALGVASFADGDTLSRLGAMRLVAVVAIASIAGAVIGYRIATRRQAETRAD